MAGLNEELKAHLQSGLTTVCRCWTVARTDGATFGFTDHDRDLEFAGTRFKADSGLTAMALQQGTGLAVDNSEAIGALSDASISEADVEAGRFDGAQVEAWIVNWAAPHMRWLQFRGSIGEIKRAGGAFQAELRGLTEMLNRPVGRVYQRPCTAVLGDGNCRFRLDTPGYFDQRTVDGIDGGRVFRWDSLDGFEVGWFARGRLTMQSGAAEGLWGLIKRDRVEAGQRVIELWEPLRAEIRAGDVVRLDTGCDKRMETCRLKFNNLVNFQGFPDIPDEDWMMAVPKQSGANTGGSLR
ncbi:DUF2163 domain-containing protein [Pukyongiella litopenaei]|uniref:DUF2163 domain-containing protein n=1 Tax=Pukyongiella litopenaei TaxID=2605946 RepID=A0A2S0MRK5_9RHOB|nr:DUF2163 domain-containing protein [Pukyongiella litopenaei]AVO38515.1 DUF2163 domain-containing protein [Pukyongiella litopenaei]